MTVKKIALTGVGIALFVVFTMCLQVPVFENYYLCLGYLVMMVYCAVVDPVSGTLTGVLGVILYCVLTNGLRGMPGWAAGNVVIGLAVGIAYRMLADVKSRPVKIAILAIVILVSTAAGILGVKSLVEHILYAQPFLVRAAKNMYAFAADVFVLWLGIPIAEIVKERIGHRI